MYGLKNRAVSALPLRAPAGLVGLLVAVLGGLGCQPAIEIRQYEVPKPPHRMLGAILFQGDEAWFFKVTGPREGLGEQRKNFEQFMQSVRFESGGRAAGPKWTLPAGWSEQGGSQLRFQTIVFEAGGEKCELAVSKLPFQGGKPDDYLLQNVNRWRGQIQQAPLLDEELAAESRKLDLPDGRAATVVDLVGTLEPKPPGGRGGMDGMPGGMRSGALAGGASGASARSPSADSPPDIKHAIPDGWEAGGATRFSKLAFLVRAGGDEVKITVTDLPAEANPLLENVNRWRGLIKLPPVRETELAEQLREIQVGDVQGKYVELSGPSEAERPQKILGVVAYRGESAWFVKLQGDASLADREKSRFEEFVKSLQF